MEKNTIAGIAQSQESDSGYQGIVHKNWQQEQKEALKKHQGLNYNS
jgi:hypothetical protein